MIATIYKVQGRPWNGWAVPYFELEEAKVIAAELSTPPEQLVEWDAATQTFAMAYEGQAEKEIYEKEWLQTPDGIKALWSLGGGSMIWDQLEGGMLQCVCFTLQVRGIAAVVEHPGYICLSTREGEWNIGTVNGTWAGELTRNYGLYSQQTFDTGIDKESTDFKEIAERIVKCINPCRRH